jgi:hypothetical protein
MYFANLSNFFESFLLYYYLSRSEYFPLFCFAKLMEVLDGHLVFSLLAVYEVIYGQ